MTKLYIQEINHCYACPKHYCPDGMKEPGHRMVCEAMDYKEINGLDTEVDGKHFPTWCPLKDKFQPKIGGLLDCLLSDEEIEKLLGIEFKHTYSGHIEEYHAIAKAQLQSDKLQLFILQEKQKAREEERWKLIQECEIQVPHFDGFGQIRERSLTFTVSENVYQQAQSLKEEGKG